MTKKKLPKAAKTGLIIFGAVLLIYIAFCIADCVRLRKAKMYTEPLITLSVKEDPETGYSNYNGLGYKIRYSHGKLVYRDESKVVYAGSASAEFIWLGVPIWGWAE